LFFLLLCGWFVGVKRVGGGGVVCGGFLVGVVGGGGGGCICVHATEAGGRDSRLESEVKSPGKTAAHTTRRLLDRLNPFKPS